MKKKSIFSLFIFICMAVLSGISIWAAFSIGKDYGIKGEYEDIETNGITLTADANNPTAHTFTAAGESKIYEYTLLNTSTTEPISYNFFIDSISNVEASKMILVYLDNVFVGTLLNINEQEMLSEGIILLPNESKSISLKYELHNAVEGSFFEDEQLSFSSVFNARTSTIDYQEYTVVASENELVQIIKSANKITSYHPTVILSNDIALTSELEITNDISIDLHGHNISGSKLSVSANVNVFSNVLTSTNTNPKITSNIELNSGYIWFSKNAKQESGTVTFADSYDASVVKEKIVDTISNKNISSGFILADGNSFYLPKLTITSKSEYTYTSGTGEITYTGSKDLPTSITIGDTIVSFKILAAGSLQSSINTALAYLDYYNMLDSNYATNGSLVVTNDLYFPTSLKAYNASITWQSSNETILKSSGETTKAGTGIATVVAIIEYNGMSYTKTYKFNVLKQNNEMKFQYLLAKMGTIRFTETNDGNADPASITEKTDDDGNHLGWNYKSNSFIWLYGVEATETTDHTTANCYAKLLEIEHLGIKSISYSVDSEYYYLTYATKSSMQCLSLTDVTFDKFAGINISVEFTDEPNIDETTHQPKVHTGVIPVEIKLSENKQIIDDIMGYVSSQFTQVSVLDNMLNTRDQYGILNEKGDFTLISDYMGYTITYTNPDTSNTYYNIVNAINYGGRIYYVVSDSVTVSSVNYSVSNGYVEIPTTATITKVTEKSVTTGTLTANDSSIQSISDATIEISGVTYTYSNGTYTKDDDANTYFIFKVDTDYIIVNSTATSVTISLKYKVLQCVKLKPEAFETTDKSISITYTVKLNGTTVSSTDGTRYDVPTFTIPACIHNDANGFANATVFTSVKLQVLSQNSIDVSAYSSFTLAGVGNYILIYDIKNTEKIVLQYGSNSALVSGNNINELIQAMDWATGSSTSTCSLFQNDTYSWITSDGNETITDKEEYAIRQYFGEIPYFNALLDTFLYGVNVRDNELTEAEANDLKTVISDYAYTKLIEWATSATNSGTTAQSVLNAIDGWNDESKITTNYLVMTGYNALTAQSNGTSSITRDEENVILRYVWSRGYANFYGTWVNYITSSDTTIGNKTYKNKDNTNTTVNELEYVLYEGLALDVFDAIVEWAEYAPSDSNASTGGNYDKAYAYISSSSNNTIGLSSASHHDTYGSTTLYEAITNKVTGLSTSMLTALFGLTDTELSQKDCWAGVNSIRDFLYTASSYTTGNLIADKEISIFDTFFKSIGLGDTYLTTNSGTYITTTSYSAKASGLGSTTVSMSDVMIFASGKVSSLRTLVQQKTTYGASTTTSYKAHSDITSIVSWATASGNSHALASTISLTNTLSATGIDAAIPFSISDGSTRVSYSEYLVLQAYLKKYYCTVGRTSPTEAFMNAALSYVLSMTLTSDQLGEAPEAELSGTLGLASEFFDNMISFAKATGYITISGTKYPVVDGKVTKDNEVYTVNSGQVTISGTAYSVTYGPFEATISGNNYGFDGIPTISETEKGYISSIVNDKESGVQTTFRTKLDNHIKNLNDKSMANKSLFQTTVQSIYPSVKYIEIPSQINANELTGFDYFTGLKEIYAHGSSVTNLFATSAAANAFLTQTTRHSASIQKISMKYAGLSSISSLTNLKKITYLDLQGNPITDISVLMNFDNGYLSYLNLWDTNIDLASSLSIIENIYTKFDSAKYTYIKKPDIRYRASGVNVYFNMTDLSKYYVMSYCYLLKDITNVTWWRYQLPDSIYVKEEYDGSHYVNVLWTVVSGAVEISTYYDSKTIHRTSKTASQAIVSATISVNGVSYTRSFTITLSAITADDPTL